MPSPVGMSKQETLIPPRITRLEIYTTEASPQSQSPLFHLSTEVRLKIYEYVIGTGQIHVVSRKCQETESPLFRTSMRTCTGPQDSVSYTKLTYSTCRNSSSSFSFRARYALSKRPAFIPIMYHNSHGDLPSIPPPEMEDFILPDWGERHEACFLNPLRDMSWQRYASAICDTNTERIHRTRPVRTLPGGQFPGGRQPCASCIALREETEKRYGPPTARQGLKKFHMDSAVQVDGLLRSCRRIYGEARGLPFKLYTFDVEMQNIRPMLEVWLEPWQSAAIERLHLSFGFRGRFSDVVQLVSSMMSGLKVLEFDLPHDDGRRKEAGDLTRLEVEAVKVVVGYDSGWNDDRADRRAKAVKLEDLLVGCKDE